MTAQASQNSTQPAAAASRAEVTQCAERDSVADHARASWPCVAACDAPVQELWCSYGGQAGCRRAVAQVRSRSEPSEYRAVASAFTCESGSRWIRSRLRTSEGESRQASVDRRRSQLVTLHMTSPGTDRPPLQKKRDQKSEKRFHARRR
jgi:hypothetical protein